MPAGAVASQDRDANKKEIARLGGGAMAAVWGGDPTGMTLELSLEMNKRLQAVLEDALLKNITLKVRHHNQDIMSPVDPSEMTLEFSLAMNKRLQAVLEDSLLKNITFKVYNQRPSIYVSSRSYRNDLSIVPGYEQTAAGSVGGCTPEEYHFKGTS
ncbi:hypothetical protein evm_015003 [Chilo suppressalis]|nr:hypothetical protein evm_015003 [Chilo suppressalis]